MIWSELVRLALLGGERSQLPPELKQKLETYGIHTDASFPEILLESSALFNQVRKAAFPLKVYPGNLPSPISETEGKPCSSSSSTHLQVILSGRYASALSEFIFHLRQNNKKIPPETLPDLFNASLNDKLLWELLQPVIGQKGEWLLKQIPEWKPLVEELDLSKWETGSLEERLKLLKVLRKTDPLKAIALLNQDWPSTSTNDKYAFLNILEPQISSSDEFFLEARLDDKQKKIRLEAARLLANISGSALIDRLFTELLNFIRPNEKSIEFEIPENLPETTLRDGIYPMPLKGIKGGMKAAWLRQTVSKVPPSKWAELLDKEAEGCLPYFIQSNWADHLIPSLAEASLLHKEESWKIALLCHLHEFGNRYEVPGNVLKNIIQSLSEEAFKTITSTFIQTASRIIEDKSTFFLLLTESRYTWPDKMTITLIQNFKDWMRTTSDNFLSIGHYREIFEAGAYVINPYLLEKLKIGWPVQSTIWYYWEDTIDKCIRTVAFRKEMIKELRTPSKG
jgi:hypothetical protein